VLAGGAKMKDRIQFACGAEFVEVRVHARTREIRCPRVVGAFAAGRIVDAATAKSRLVGGLIWGVSSALHEATEIDHRRARYCNTDLAEYLIPVNADIDEAQVILIPEEDHLVNDLGIKGLGELGNVGTNATVANAVCHATGSASCPSGWKNCSTRRQLSFNRHKTSDPLYYSPKRVTSTAAGRWPTA
jgi:xanthine dehydrogenase YagR molybdenum-binding subunit